MPKKCKAQICPNCNTKHRDSKQGKKCYNAVAKKKKILKDGGKMMAIGDE